MCIRRAVTLVAIVAGGTRAHADDLSLAQAVRSALASDAELYIARENTLAAGDEIDLAESVFSPRLTGALSWARDDKPPSARSFAREETLTNAELGVTGRIASTGLSYTLSGGLLHQRTRRDPFTTVYDPAATATLGAVLVQPLWRGAFGRARKPIEVASRRRARTEYELQSRIEQTIALVESTYWNLVRARSELDARRAALTLAKEQVQESKRVARLGNVADLDVVEAETGVSRRNQEVLRSEQEVVEAEGRLLQAIGARAGDAAWPEGRSIVPTDVAKIDASERQLDAMLALARERRADARAAREQIAAETAELAVTADNQRVGLDLVIAGGTVGFGGTLATSYATAGVNGGGLNPPYTTDPAYDGGVDKALRNLSGRDINVFVGVQLDMPLGDHEAKVRHSLQRRSLSRARLGARETLSRLESEVRTAVARVALDVKIVTASDQAVALAEKLQDGMRKRFRAGDATTFDVLRVSEELTRARVDAARARADYRIGLTRLAAATGTLLDPYSITIKSLGKTPP